MLALLAFWTIFIDMDKRGWNELSRVLPDDYDAGICPEDREDVQFVTVTTQFPREPAHLLNILSNKGLIGDRAWRSEYPRLKLVDVSFIQEEKGWCGQVYTFEDVRHPNSVG